MSAATQYACRGRDHRQQSWRVISNQFFYNNPNDGASGDLPIKRQYHLYDLLRNRSPPPMTLDGDLTRLLLALEVRALENVQILLQLEGKETDMVLLRQHQYRSERDKASPFPYHDEILGHWEQFARAQADNQLEVFEISDVTLPPAPFFNDHIVPILQNDTMMRLDLINCGLGSSELRGVAEVLKKCPSLISLCLAQNKIVNIDDAKCLASAMTKHKQLFVVDLSMCELGESDEILSEMLKGCKKLNILDLRGNEFSSTSINLIAKFLSTHKKLTSLYLGEKLEGGSELADESVQSLNTAVEKNKTLEEISLASTKITLETKTQRSLVLNDKLLHIDLSWNSLGTTGAKHIAKHLKKNPPLTMLSLTGCSLPNRSAEGLCNALKRNTNLAHLDLRRNNFNDKSVPFFADALRNNGTLLTLHMSDNKLKVKSGRKDLITLALCDPTSLETIADSNHTCLVTLNTGVFGNRDTNEEKFRNINALENEGQKIRYKVIVSLFTLKTIAFNPRDFQNVPLELMPLLLELVQQEMGYGRYGREVWKAPIRRKGSNPCLSRVYEVIHSWSALPSLFARGPGKIKKKAKKRKHIFAFKDAEDEEWTPNNRY